MNFLLGFPLKLSSMRALGYGQGLNLTIKGLTMKKVLLVAAVAAISTVAVTDGMKGMVKKFAYRINILDSVLKEQNIAVSF